MINGSAAGNQTFSGTASALNHNVILNFNGLNDKIDITGHAFNGTTTATYTPMAGTNNQTGTLSIKDSGGTIDSFELIGGNNIASFHVASDCNGGILVTDPPLSDTTSHDSVPVLPHMVDFGHEGFNFAFKHPNSAFSDAASQVGSSHVEAAHPGALVSSNGDQFVFLANHLTQPAVHETLDGLAISSHETIGHMAELIEHGFAEAANGAVHTLPTPDDLSPNHNLHSIHGNDGFHLA